MKNLVSITMIVFGLLLEVNGIIHDDLRLLNLVAPALFIIGFDLRYLYGWNPGDD